MYVTHSYLGITKGKFRCLFFLLLEDYIEAQSQFVRELTLQLERFARNMGNDGVLVRPFEGDIETTRAHFLDKPWTPEQRSEVCNTPGLLMIEVDFDDFNPREHRWLFFSFGDRLEDPLRGARWNNTANAKRACTFATTLADLAQAINDADTDIFESAHAVVDKTNISGFAKMFEAKPGIFGFSIDLIRGAELIHALYLKWANGKHLLEAPIRPNGWTRCPKCGIAFSTANKDSWDGYRHITCGAYLAFVESDSFVPIRTKPTPNNELWRKNE